MRRNSLLLLVGAAAALAVACRDSAVAPVRSPTALSASASPSLSSSKSNQNRTLLGTIELSPNGGTYHVGDFDILMPAAAVCEPSTTKYGPRHWDEDCAPARRSVTVNVVARKLGNRVSVDFEPDLRFRPSAGWVVIQTSAYSDLLQSATVRRQSPQSSYFENFAILYVPTGGRSQINEARASGDQSMMTYVDLRTGLVWRRVKHFSGYLVTAGQKCDPNLTGGDVNCPATDELGLGGVGASSSSLALGGLSMSVFVIPNDSTTSP